MGCNISTDVSTPYGQKPMQQAPAFLFTPGQYVALKSRSS